MKVAVATNLERVAIAISRLHLTLLLPHLKKLESTPQAANDHIRTTKADSRVLHPNERRTENDRQYQRPDPPYC